MEVQKKHVYLDSFKTEIETALEYYPQLEDVKITFKFKSDIEKIYHVGSTQVLELSKTKA
jgi:hypothetical protein